MSIAVVCTVAISWLPSAYARSRAKRRRGVRRRPMQLAQARGANGRDQRLLRIGCSAYAWPMQRLSRPIVSLDRFIAVLLGEEVKADRARLRTCGRNAAARRILGVLRHQGRPQASRPSTANFACSKKADRGAQKTLTNCAYELDQLISRFRTASTRRRGGSRP